MSTLKPFSDIGDANFPCVLMTSISSAVQREGIVDTPDVFVPAFRGVLPLVPAHFLPDIIRDALPDNLPLPELTVKQISRATARAVNDCIDESRYTGVFADSWALVQKVSPGTDGILPFFLLIPKYRESAGPHSPGRVPDDRQRIASQASFVSPESSYWSV